jgi:hypothetical protein
MRQRLGREDPPGRHARTADHRRPGRRRPSQPGGLRQDGRHLGRRPERGARQPAAAGHHRPARRVAVALVNPQSARCADVSGASTAAGAQIQIWDWNGTGAQKFTFQPNGSILVPASGTCLDVTASGTANGTKVQLYTCKGTGAQRWTAA